MFSKFEKIYARWRPISEFFSNPGVDNAYVAKLSTHGCPTQAITYGSGYRPEAIVRIELFHNEMNIATRE